MYSINYIDNVRIYLKRALTDIKINKNKITNNPTV